MPTLCFIYLWVHPILEHYASDMRNLLSHPDWLLGNKLLKLLESYGYHIDINRHTTLNTMFLY